MWVVINMKKELIEEIRKAEFEGWKLCIGCVIYIIGKNEKENCGDCSIQKRKRMGLLFELKLDVKRATKSLRTTMKRMCEDEEAETDQE